MSTSDNQYPTGHHISRRTFLKAGAASAVGVTALAACGKATHDFLKTVDAKGRVLIIGGGAAGCSMAARLARRIEHPDITIVDPSERQFYQPGFTFVAAGIFKPGEVWRPQREFIPRGVRWVKDTVAGLDPSAREARTAGGKRLGYDFLVLCPGIQLDWHQVEGITRETLGQGNAHCIYDFLGAQKYWKAMREFTARGGRGVFTDTYTKHKCGGAPKKICMLTEHMARKRGTRSHTRIDYFCSEKALYDVPYYTPRLLHLYGERGIGLQVNCRVKGIDTQARRVYMERHETRKETVWDSETGHEVERETRMVTPFAEDYDLLSFVPPQSAPDFIRQSGLAWTHGKLAAGGWVEVDKETLVHTRFPNIIALGDCAGIPTSKTSSAIRMQLPVAEANLLDLMQGREPSKRYDGYACCPIVTDYGHVLLCEFDYEKRPAITFPFSMQDMSHERRTAWWLKRRFLKPMYFNAMLKGYM